MVAKEDNDRAIRELKTIQFNENLADLRIDEANAREVGAFENSKLFFFDAVIERVRGQGGRRNVRNVFRRFFVQRDLIERVQIKVRRGGDVRNVRPVKSRGDEKRLGLMRVEQADRFSGDLAVGLFVVSAFG